MSLDHPIVPLIITAAAFGAGYFRRWRRDRQVARERARHVEAERIVALLSNKQPGVWDQEDLRQRFQQIARDFWSLPTLADLRRLETWVAEPLLTGVQRWWPRAAERREAQITFKGPIAFMQVHEGGPGPDRLIARLAGSRETRYLDARGKAIAIERKTNFISYHTWIHIDGQGWQLQAIDSALGEEEAPFSVACRILPQATAEKIEHT